MNGIQLAGTDGIDSGNLILPNQKQDTILSQITVDMFNYRKSHHLGGTIPEEYQLSFITYYGSGSDSGNAIYLNEHCQIGFDDVRFAYDDDLPLIYWRESYVEGNLARFWVELPDPIPNDKTFYIYYGNDQIQDESDGDATFIFFDDFENGNLDKWDISTGWALQDSIAYSGSAIRDLGSDGQGNLQKDLTLTSIFMIHTQCYATNPRPGGYPVMARNKAGLLIYGGAIKYYALRHFNGSVYTMWEYISANTWWSADIGFDLSGNRIYYQSNGVNIDYPLKDGRGGSVSSISAVCAFGRWESGHDLYLDNYFITKWIPSGPSHGDWGNETQNL